VALSECFVESDGDRPVIVVRGEIDSSNVADLRECIDGVLHEGHLIVVIDLAGLEYVDSAGLNVLAGTLRRMRDAGGELWLRSPSRWTRRLLEVSGLLTRFKIIDGDEPT
jgi:anti-anti-sigma factor